MGVRRRPTGELPPRGLDLRALDSGSENSPGLKEFAKRKIFIGLCSVADPKLLISDPDQDPVLSA